MKVLVLSVSPLRSISEAENKLRSAAFAYKCSAHSSEAMFLAVSNALK